MARRLNPLPLSKYRFPYLEHTVSYLTRLLQERGYVFHQPSELERDVAAFNKAVTDTAHTAGFREGLRAAALLPRPRPAKPTHCKQCGAQITPVGGATSSASLGASPGGSGSSVSQSAMTPAPQWRAFARELHE